MRMLSRIFAPALLVWPLWLYTISGHRAWTAVFRPYWPMGAAMGGMMDGAMKAMDPEKMIDAVGHSITNKMP